MREATQILLRDFKFGQLTKPQSEIGKMAEGAAEKRLDAGHGAGEYFPVESPGGLPEQLSARVKRAGRGREFPGLRAPLLVR